MPSNGLKKTENNSLKKSALIFFVFFMMSGFLFAQKYRYVAVMANSSTNACISVMDYPEKVAEEKLNELFFAANTSEEKFIAESGVQNIKYFYDLGYLTLLYVDFTKDKENPEYYYINNWQELIEYIRGKR